MIVLAGGNLVLPGRVLPSASLIIDGGRIAGIDPRPRVDPEGAAVVDVGGSYVVPGFIDVHVHGVEGFDTLDGGAALGEIAARLPRYGVTAFCPTSVACPPGELRTLLDQVRALRAQPPHAAARVLPAHLESNFINPAFAGAQPPACLRSPLSGDVVEGDFSAADILGVIAAARADVGIVTMAPELPGGIDLVRSLTAHGHRVSLGHTGASYEEASAAIDAGARHATHLFNRMTLLGHRAPGVAGAVLERDDVAAELICDGYHVHTAMCRTAIAAKGVGAMMAITDGTGGSGLPVGSSARLGGRSIRVGARAATLDDGTLAGSTLTMDKAFANIVTLFGRSIVDAAVMCATTPARALGLAGYGAIEGGAVADLVVLSETLEIVRTFVGGEEIFTRDARRGSGDQRNGATA